MLRASRPEPASRSRGTDERAEHELAVLLGDEYAPASPPRVPARIRPAFLVNGLVAAVVVAVTVLTFALVGTPRHQPTAGGGSSDTTSGTTASPDVLKALRAFRAFAADQSTDGTYTIEYVVTTAGAAETAFYGSASMSSNFDLPDTPAVAFVATGSFSPWDFKRAPGTKPGPPARYLTRVAALADGGTMDTGLGDDPLDLAKLGIPIRDERH